MKKLFLLTTLWWTAAIAHAAPDLQWSFSGLIPDKFCTPFNETLDPDMWHDNYLCSSADIGLQFNNSGPIPEKQCILLNEPSDPDSWGDNYLCWKKGLNVDIRFSFAGALPGMSCINTPEPSDPHTWSDNFICTAEKACEVWSGAGFSKAFNAQTQMSSLKNMLLPYKWETQNNLKCTQWHRFAPFELPRGYSPTEFRCDAWGSVEELKYIPGFLHDSISSAWVRQGCSLTLFEHEDFQGVDRIFAGGSSDIGQIYLDRGTTFSDLGDFNNRASSLKCSCDNLNGSLGSGGMYPLIAPTE